MKKLVNVLLTVAVVLGLSLTMAAPVAVSAGGAPTIDGVLGADEWGSADFESTGYFSVYVLNDADYLYVAYKAEGGTYLPTGDGDVGMANVYIHNLDTHECWAYCWIHRTPSDIGLEYNPDYLKEPEGATWQTLPTTDAVFAVSETVFELWVPLSELSMISLGDTIGFHFGSYSQGLTDWDTWLLPAFEDMPIEYLLEGNTAVGLTAETSNITAINVDPTSIDFGTITPGTPNDGDTITVENIGGVTVDVDAYLAPMTNTVFNYLKDRKSVV